MGRHKDYQEYEDYVDEGPLILVEKGGGRAPAFFWGALLGAGAALLLAPRSGAETREGLVRGARRMSTAARDMAEELGDTVVDRYDHARHTVESGMDSLRRAVEVKRHQASQAVRAGRAAAEAARDELERRIAESGSADGPEPDAAPAPARRPRRPRRAAGGGRGGSRPRAEDETAEE